MEMIKDLDFSGVFEKLGAENNFLIIIEENFFETIFPVGSDMKRPNQPLFYHPLRKDNESHVKDWIKGNKNSEFVKKNNVIRQPEYKALILFQVKDGN